jgi:hypothetical protein
MIGESISDRIDWDGSALCFDAPLDGGLVHCRVPRSTVHAIRLYSDAIEREIVIDRFNIVEKLRPFLRAKLSTARAGDTLELLPDEIFA